MSYVEKKPIKRSKLRLFMGKNYYTIKKYIHWYFSNKSYSKKVSSDKVKYLVFTHKTPLYRKLKNVDMYLQENKVEKFKISFKKA